MAALPTLFADGVVDVHIANGVARITLATMTGQPPQQGEAPRANPSGILVVPVTQLPILGRVFAEVTRQLEQRAKEAAQQPAQAGGGTNQGHADQPGGAFRFNG
ncbi:hypothetical protein [Falsiroseomonas oryziterrae]|uniref:hypothetical protein n=1 Tax=Falsiroseomonas oryziterrae TaxID=2911368 RepID=UPI001F46737F|nr:hypothetical protein [Roseomonas sp. NPKOSM-4]